MKIHNYQLEHKDRLTCFLPSQAGGSFKEILQ